MRFWLSAVAEPKRIAAQVLTTSPMKVRTLGLMRDRASQRTMVSSSTPQARPKALVQEVLMAVPCAVVERMPGSAGGGCRQAAGPSTPQDRSQTNDRAAPGMTGHRRPASGFRLFDVLCFVVDRAQAENIQLALAVGRDHHHGIADFLVEQAAADGRVGGNLSGG